MSEPALLPSVVQEIAEVAGYEAAWALVEAKGGQEVFIPRKAARAQWLVAAVGAEAAEAICAHFRSNHQSKVLIPNLRRRRTAEAIVRAIEAGKTNNQAAAVTGVHERTVRRYRRRLREEDSQGELF